MKFKGNMSSSSDMSESSSSSEDNELLFYCHLCNKKAKGATENKPVNEICKTCQGNFPERMFCKSCKRFYTNKEPFGKSRDRCTSCVDKLEKMREARKKRSCEPKEKEEVKRKRKNEDTKSSEEIEENYVAVFVKGNCVVKKTFKM